MRVHAALVAVVFGAGMTGCLGDGDPAPPTQATPTPPIATPTAEPTPVTPVEPTVPSGSPIPPPPRTVYNRSFDFSTQGDPTGQRPTTESSSAVSEEYGLLVVNVTIVRSNSGTPTLPISGTINSPAVRVFDPDGEEILVETQEGAERFESFPAKVGTYSVRFEGAGTLRATVILTATT